MGGSWVYADGALWNGMNRIEHKGGKLNISIHDDFDTAPEINWSSVELVVISGEHHFATLRVLELLDPSIKSLGLIWIRIDRRLVDHLCSMPNLRSLTLDSCTDSQEENGSSPLDKLRLANVVHLNLSVSCVAEIDFRAEYFPSLRFLVLDYATRVIADTVFRPSPVELQIRGLNTRDLDLFDVFVRDEDITKWPVDMWPRSITTSGTVRFGVTFSAFDHVGTGRESFFSRAEFANMTKAVEKYRYTVGPLWRLFIPNNTGAIVEFFRRIDQTLVDPNAQIHVVGLASIVLGLVRCKEFPGKWHTEEDQGKIKRTLLFEMPPLTLCRTSYYPRCPHKTCKACISSPASTWYPPVLELPYTISCTNKPVKKITCEPEKK